MPIAKAGNVSYFVPDSVAKDLGYNDPHQGAGSDNGSMKEAVGLFNAIAKALGAETIKMPTLADLARLNPMGESSKTSPT
ncbi:hypothetical protein FGW37_17175 [Streptomyces rectiverticillatus]|uniref:hypothetical protein n=1 Tax=Streptomyces rectiverticillatus TaxID=173860 RepID=UPI0015C40237|nr:hypothetical protein [Streptomyces rectiverticillatus]QLE73094.1 hypothetical protein FGW37_17175 [Streptomyces rectiverticillatus]